MEQSNSQKRIPVFRIVFISAIVLLMLSLMIPFKKIFNKNQSSYDIDIVNMSATMKYATALDINNNQDEYLNKTINVEGYYEQITEGEKVWNTVCIYDITKCCKAYLRFDSNESLDYESNSTIMINGLLEQVTIDGVNYIYINL